MTPLTPIEALLSAAEKATPGPWVAHGNLPREPITLGDGSVHPGGKCRCAQVYCEWTCVAQAIGARHESWTLGEGVTDEKCADNADFIAAARNSISDLRALLKQHRLMREWILTIGHQSGCDTLDTLNLDERVCDCGLSGLRASLGE